MAITARSALEYLVLLVPLYIFLLNPLLSSYLGNSNTAKPGNTFTSKNQPRSRQMRSTAYDDLDCPQHSYTTTLISRRNPLMLHISPFLSASETAEIKAIASTNYTASPVYQGNTPTLDSTLRNSLRAPLPDTTTFRCIAARAMAFQGWPADTHIEPLWAQKYEQGGFYHFHYDWEGDVATMGGGRVSTFMVYVDCEDCVGGGTHFPNLQLPDPLPRPLCDAVECPAADGADALEGAVFKPVPGSALYWENFGDDGVGLETTLHRALEVERGTKIGLNVWSWYQPGSSKARLEQKQRDASMEIENDNENVGGSPGEL